MNYPLELKIGDRVYPVSYLEAARMTSSVKIKKDRVILKLSRFSYGPRRDEMIRKFLKWAEKRLAKMSVKDFVLPDYKDGGRISTHNKIYELNVNFRANKTSRVAIKNNIIEISLNRELSPVKQKYLIKNLAEKAIIKDQTPYLHEVVDELNQMFYQESYDKCRFKRTSSRFGSCSSRRNINIAFRLLYAPREVFRYVCAHELSHLKAMNHSKKFWQFVQQAIPDYKVYEKWLRNNGLMLG